MRGMLQWMLRLLVQWAAKKVRQLRAFPVAGSLLCIMECCMACLERFVTFINRSTVIVAAFTGKGYCASSRKAGALIMANVLRVAGSLLLMHHSRIQSREQVSRAQSGVC